jgi:hypothetical protein
MSTQVQFRRGNTSQISAFTGAVAEITVDTQQKTITIHDGVTPGGTYLSTKAFAQAAFDTANAAIGGAITFANVALTHSNTVSGIPNANTLHIAEPSINLNDGRMFIQLNNGKVVDISSTPVGNTYYVSMNGNDNYEGTTPSSAKATIKAAIAMAGPGDSVDVLSGTYIVDNPILIPQQVQLQGSGERNCIIKPANPTQDILWVNNNSYVTGFKFVDYTSSAVAFPATIVDSGTAQSATTNTITLASSAYTGNNYYKDLQIVIASGTGSGQSANISSYNGVTKVATISTNWSTPPDSSSVYNLKVLRKTSPASSSSRYSTYITGSPYVYNCSSVTTTGTGITIDGDLAMGNKSIISAQFTQVNSGGTGIHIKNDGYSQLVSIYGIFCDTAFLAESGGTASLGNCNVNFGNRGLVANGKGKLAMTAALSNTSNQASYTVELNTVVANTDLSITANVPYNGLVMYITGDDTDWYEVVESTSLSSGKTTVTFQAPIANSWPSGTTVKFYQQSQLRASGQTFEFVGAGTSIQSIPRLGGVANTDAQITNIGEGRVFATSTNQQGNFQVADLTINQATSTISGRTFSKSLFAEMTPYILALEA